MGVQIEAAPGVRYADDHDLQGRGPLFHREVSKRTKAELVVR